MENKLTISAIIMMITGFVFVGYNDLEPTHACYSREIKAYCYDLSSTAKTCYTAPATKRIGGKRCTEAWTEIPFIETVSELSISRGSASKVNHCNREGCF